MKIKPKSHIKGPKSKENPRKKFNTKNQAPGNKNQKPNRNSAKDRFLDQHTNSKLPKTMVGKIRVSKTGNGFIDLKEGGSIIIPRGELDGAIDRDTVKIELLPRRRGKPGDAGTVIDIVKRGTDHIAGVVDCEGKNFFLKPIKKNFPFLVHIKPGTLQNAICGSAALAKITSWQSDVPGNVEGEIAKVYGMRGDHESDMSLILSETLAEQDFDQKLMDALNDLPEVDVEAEIKKGRRDFRGISTCTIDPERAQDFDDALSIRFLSDDEYEIGIHIADVSYYVTPNSIIDVEAYRRATSVYLVDRCVPMLPERLSNDLCSLKEGVPRLTMSVVVRMMRDGKINEIWAGPGIILSDKRFTYSEVDVILENKKGLLYKELNKLMELAEIMEKDRVARGALIFNRDEIRFVLDNYGKPINIIREKSSPSHTLIESFMLLANKIVADKNSSRENGMGKKAGMYRVHDEPNETAIIELASFAKACGIPVDLKLKKPIDIIKHIIKKSNGLPISKIMDDMVIRSQAKAHYSEANSGHFGLALKSYCHFTSPIRRYPDLITHRILRESLMNKKISYNVKELAEAAIHSSEREEKAAESERASIRYKQIEFLENKIGTERTGMLVGVSEMALKIIDDETMGMVHAVPNKIKFNLGDRIKYDLTVADRLQDELIGEVTSII